MPCGKGKGKGRKRPKRPRYQELWEKIPPARRTMLHQDFLQDIPGQFWEDVVQDASAPAWIMDPVAKDCIERGELALARQRRKRLERKGIRDLDGYYLGESGFGKYENPMKGHVPSAHVLGEHDHDHGIKDCPIVPDLACQDVTEGLLTWGEDYMVLPDGSHGPRKFRTRDEKLRYMNLTGHAENGSYTH